ncbi:hypothetical protein [Amycolatopsis sp. Poz14]|nr:hypothetical protein [Amycolatopsis sp. Poz14]
MRTRTTVSTGVTDEHGRYAVRGRGLTVLYYRARTPQTRHGR